MKDCMSSDHCGGVGKNFMCLQDTQGFTSHRKRNMVRMVLQNEHGIFLEL